MICGDLWGSVGICGDLWDFVVPVDLVSYVFILLFFVFTSRKLQRVVRWFFGAHVSMLFFDKFCHSYAFVEVFPRLLVF